MTVKELLDKLNYMLDHNLISEDWKVIISDDEEGNGFHLPYYVEDYIQTEEDILDGCEDVEKDLL